MPDNFIPFGNIKDILLVLVGFIALVVYFLQERRKTSESASLIVMKVEELKKQHQKINSYIVNGNLNSSAFYESQPLFQKNYWNEYKHYFVRKIDSGSFGIFDEFYNCASEILEQQQFMKTLQKNFFFLTQQTLVQMESYFFQQAMSSSCQTPFDINQFVQAMGKMLPQSISSEQQTLLENMVKDIATSNPNFDSDIILRNFEKNRSKFHEFINSNALTSYIPGQIRISLENALKREASIEIIGCEGYRKMKKIASRMF